MNDERKTIKGETYHVLIHGQRREENALRLYDRVLCGRGGEGGGYHGPDRAPRRSHILADAAGDGPPAHPGRRLFRPQSATCAIRKDSGDDPDITDGMLVYGTVEKTPSGLSIVGGIGVGRVTQPGLACAVGDWAINPVPRRMITEALQAACRLCGYTGGLCLTLSIPEGQRLAQKTFNPRLGIVGGLSILGTSGIVDPMSEQALLIRSIRKWIPAALLARPIYWPFSAITASISAATIWASTSASA